MTRGGADVDGRVAATLPAMLDCLDHLRRMSAGHDEPRVARVLTDLAASAQQCRTAAEFSVLCRYVLRFSAGAGSLADVVLMDGGQVSAEQQRFSDLLSTLFTLAVSGL